MMRIPFTSIGFEKEPRELGVNGRSDGRFFLEHDGVAVAAFDDGSGRGEAAGVLKDDDADGLRGLQILLADELAEGVAELLEAHHSVAPGAGPGIGEDFERRRGEFDPVIVRCQEAGEKR